MDGFVRENKNLKLILFGFVSLCRYLLVYGVRTNINYMQAAIKVFFSPVYICSFI